MGPGNEAGGGGGILPAKQAQKFHSLLLASNSIAEADPQIDCLLIHDQPSQDSYGL